MQQLEALTQEAVALANGGRVAEMLSYSEAEVARQMQICNACRYCEGFCAVFPAMKRRLEFGKTDIHYLANLCHNCGACLHACQYAPPHEFAINVPKAMAKVRGQTYAYYAWPPALGALYQRNGLAISLALAVSPALFLLLSLVSNGTLWGGDLQGNFYNLFPHNLMVGMFTPVFLWAVLALSLSVRRFWRDVTPVTSGQPLSSPAAAEATLDVLRLKYLDGGHGEGCHDADDAYTLSRQRAHHLTFYGFMLCFASTSLATTYHYVFGLVAPYNFPSLPKVLGAVGGVSLLLGTAWLFRLNRQRHPLHGDAAQKPMDLGFIALLFFTSSTGLALWLGRGTAALPTLLALHLGVVMALFALMPYGKFAHGVFRTAAHTLLLIWGTAPAQDLPPKKTGSIVVGFAPGGAADTAARLIAKKLGENIGQSVIIDNRSGAGGNIAHQFVASSAGDGATLLFGSVGPLTIAPHMMMLAYDPVRDLSPITMGVNFPNVLVVHAGMGVKTLAEFVALAKKKPGALDFASTGAGSASHLAGELFNMRAGIDTVHIP